MHEIICFMHSFFLLPKKCEVKTNRIKNEGEKYLPSANNSSKAKNEIKNELKDPISDIRVTNEWQYIRRVEKLKAWLKVPL
jgi:hypothetical protein